MVAFYLIFMKYGHALFGEEVVIRENTVDHFTGHIPFASLEGDKRPDKINQKSREFEHFTP